MIHHAFTPTHRHVEGGKYEVLREGLAKFGPDDKWEPAVFYCESVVLPPPRVLRL